jgi:hypothetical protein
VDVDDPAPEPCNKPRRQDLHEPGEHDELHAALVEPVRDRDVARRPVRVFRGRENACLYPGIPRPLDRPRIRLVRAYADDLDAVTAMDLVDQRLEVRPGPGGEDPDRERHDATESTG